LSVSDWTFLSDHAHVLVVLARDPRSDGRAVAKATGTDIDTVQVILHELEEAGFIRREREGATEFTFIDRTKTLRHPVEGHHAVGRLLHAVESSSDVLRVESSSDVLRDRIVGTD